ncbi:hypothetical protein PRZ48_010172 [Zasmidium cellare]|uniref:Uncharacterized protein n=1 Tax=Zasmidium cellare TaxID=395010 RepID=A0ABR0EDT0_ZASCE|nr:hypothetical protein PRZ48_010172 [Zasmidium cellare]
MQSEVRTGPAGLADLASYADRVIRISPQYQAANVPAELFKPWPCKDNNCNDCDEHFRHIEDLYQQCLFYSKNVSEAEAKAVTSMLSSIAQHYQRRLKQNLEQHGDLFMSRWKKRDADKRAELLIRANKHLPEQRVVTLYNLTESNGGQHDWRQSLSFAMLLPYLALDTLKENPNFIYALLHYRTEYSLEDWATFDLHQFWDPWKVGLLSIDFSPMCVIVHGTEYGKSIPFDGASVHRGDAVGFPRARLLLEAQAKLMQFLTKVFDLTLEGGDLDNPSSARWTAMCHEGFQASGDVSQWSSYRNQPFCAPPLLDIDAIVSAAKLRFDAAADHFALLQTDPAYMRRYIRIIMQGSAFKDIPKTDTFMTVDAHIGFEIKSLYWWLCVMEAAEHVRDVRRRFRDQIQRGSPLPRQYDRALASLELVLVTNMIERGDVYGNELMQRPGFSQYFSREYQGQGRAVVRRKFKGPSAKKLATDPLFWCLINICAGPDEKSSFDHSHLFTFLEDHLARSPAEERARVDQVLYDQFSELAANHQLLLAVRLNRPQNKAGDGLEMLQTEKRRAWKDKLCGAGNVPQTFERAALLQRLHEATPLPGRKDATWIERHDQIHSTLSTYWSSIRDSAKDHMKDDVVARHLKADLDQKYQAELAKERQTVLDEVEARKIVPKVVPGLQTPSSTEKVKPAEKKTKAKTRPEPPEQSLETSTPSPKETVECSTTTARSVSATKRAIGVFTKMFSTEAAETGQSCEWIQFVHAMRDVGFSARNSTGSAVVFELKDQGKIIFHRPHPVAKIDPVMLKAMGKRMAKWFGWSRRASWRLQTPKADFGS